MQDVEMASNAVPAVVQGFGDEWTRFDQSEFQAEEEAMFFKEYFSIFPWASLPPNARGFDLGSGSGRWAKLVATRVKHLTCLDASLDALAVAQRTVAHLPNVECRHAVAGRLPFPDAYFDFGYSLGVLHHVPDTQQALTDAVRTLRAGAPFLLYLYYSFENRPWWFRLAWRVGSQGPRYVLSRMPKAVRFAACDVIAALVYWPLARLARSAARRGQDVEHWILHQYRDASFYTMRTDALDRFGTQLEKRYSRALVQTMMERAGLNEITFSDGPAYWVACGRKG